MCVYNDPQGRLDLIDFTQLPKWIEDLEDARRLLGRFIRRLRQEVEDELP